MYGMYTLKDLEIAGFLVLPYEAALFVGAGLSNKVAAQWYRRIIFLFLLVLSVSLLFRTTWMKSGRREGSKGVLEAHFRGVSGGRNASYCFAQTITAFAPPSQLAPVVPSMRGAAPPAQ
jgi:hypothetical protein